VLYEESGHIPFGECGLFYFKGDGMDSGIIIEALLKVKKAIKQKFGDDGKNVQGGRRYKNGPAGTDRIHYEIERIAAAITHSTIGDGAIIPPLPEDAGDGDYTLTAKKDGGIVNYEWIENIPE
jgi:hypothetical protein